MMQIQPYTLLLVFAFLCIECMAKQEKEETFNINGLSGDKINVDIQSEISGEIIWMLTDDHNFRLKVNIAGENENLIDSVGIHLTKTNSSVELLVREKHFSIAPAHVTGTGSKIIIPAFLIWILALVLCWNNPFSIILVVAVYGFTPGTAENSFDFSKKSVRIEVIAPRRFSYNKVNLSINGGKLRVVNWERERIEELKCKTEFTTKNGCSNCCHGNGVCTQNRCICDENFDEMSNCATSTVKSVLFSHPLDPRFDRIFLPDEDILTLGRAFQFVQQETYLRDPDKYALEIKSRDLSLPHVLVMFHSNGLVEKFIDTKSGKGNIVKFKRSKLNPCIIRVKGYHVNREINVCDSNNAVGGAKNIKNENTSKVTEERDNYVNKKDLKKKRKHKHVYFTENELKFVELPVRIHRCGYNSKQRKYVYFKIFKDKMYTRHESISRTESNNSLIKNENIFLLSHKTLHGAEMLRLSENSIPLGIEEKTQRCEMTKSLHGKICFSSNLESLSIICDNFSNEIGLNNSTPSQFSKTFHFCKHVLKTVSSYCNKHFSNVLTQDKSCLTHYTYTVNLFSTDTYLIQPFAIFPDDKLISGRVQHVNFGNLSQLKIQNKELVIIDNDAEFKIVKISVIPKDPLPHDIYQVKLDYECASSDTAVKMTVYGSDFYSNSVTCHGVTHCSCCILHAAGAPNAVVDRVTINVTDPSRNYELIREMVVVF